MLKKFALCLLVGLHAQGLKKISYRFPMLYFSFKEKTYAYNLENAPKFAQEAINSLIYQLKDLSGLETTENSFTYLTPRRLRYTHSSWRKKTKLILKDSLFHYQKKARGELFRVSLLPNKILKIQKDDEVFSLVPSESSDALPDFQDHKPNSTSADSTAKAPENKLIRIAGSEITIISAGDTLKLAPTSDIRELDFYKKLPQDLKLLLERELKSSDQKREIYIRDGKSLEIKAGDIKVEIQPEDIETRTQRHDTVAPSDRRVIGHDFYLELHVNMWKNVPTLLKSTFEGLGSTKFNLTYQLKVRLGDSYYLSPGIGIVWRTFRLKNPLLLSYDRQSDSLNFAIDTTANLFSKYKSRMQFTYLHLPLEVGFMWKRLLVAAYGFVDVLLEGQYKNKKSRYDMSYKTLITGDWGTKGVQYGVGVRVGYRGVGLFASTTLSPLWKRNPSNVTLFQGGIFISDLDPFLKRKKLSSSVSHIRVNP